MRALSVVLAVAAVVAARPASAAQRSPDPAAACNLPHATGVSAQELTSSQRPRAYRLFVPPGYDGRRRLPLVLDLHGSGGSAAGQARTSGMETLAATELFLVATLEAVDARWNVPVQDGRASDVTYASDVIDHVAAQVCTDETRVYATGFSGGARMSSLLGCHLDSRLAAIAPVSGLRYSTPCTRRVPGRTLHRLADPQNT
jgi:polyhydroxybutyrate depolymerase